MDRLKLWLLPVYALVGFLIVVGLMPKTSWLARLQAETLLLPKRGNNDSDMSNIFPLGPQPSDPAPDDDTKLIQLMDSTRHALTDLGNQVQLRPQRLQALFNLCQAKHSREYWAQYVRISYGESRVSLAPRDRGGPPPAQWLESRKMMVQACEAGTQLDHSNAFFPCIEAGALYNLGDVTGAREKLVAASQCAKFDEYISLEIDARYRWLLHTRGYRGNQAKTMIMASVLFPHFAEMKWICRATINGGKPADRVAAMRLGGLLMRSSKSLIGMLVGKSIVSVALKPPTVDGSVEGVPDPDVIPATQKLESAVPSSEDLSVIAGNYKALKPPFKDLPGADFEGLIDDPSRQIGMAALAAVLLLPLLLLATWAKSIRENISAASPFLIWLLMALTVHGPDPARLIEPCFMVGALLFFPALSPKARREVDIFGWVLTGLALMVMPVFQCYALILPIILFPVCLIVERRATNIPAWVTATVFIVLFGALLGGLIELMTVLSTLEESIMGFLAVIAVAAAVQVRAPFRWQPIAGIACLIIGGTYGYSVFKQLAADRFLGKTNVLWDHESQSVRDSLGIR